MPDITSIVYAVISGIIQGVTEWLPVSSTGHLIIFDSLMKSRMDPEIFTPDFTEMFNVVIQLGSILAVVALYFGRLDPLSKNKTKAERKKAFRLWGRIALASVPVFAAGLLFDGFLSEKVFVEPQVNFIIAGALFVYGVLFVIIDKRTKNKTSRITSPEDMTPGTAFGVGAFQVLALIPGTSRSGSTILGATALGASRSAAAEFSFFLAIPVMFGASGLKAVKYISQGTAFSFSQTVTLFVGTATAFIVSLFAVKFLVSFVKRRGFAPFGWYRMILSAFVALFFAINK
ncbi:MAG: undecaprenyl-diphosphate phosphatase [Clostridia bacterium]|nr:undecaprenyl-diphosphate phosphatase [Clostridia bacterium]